MQIVNQRENLMVDKILVVGMIIVSAVILSYSDFGNQGRVYDCSLAEFHPDYPKEVKEECRKLIEEYRRQEEKRDSKIYI